MLEIPSRSDEAPSTFILNTLGGGGDQQQDIGGLEVGRVVCVASEKSSIELLAICQTCEGEEHFPSWMVLFLLYQIAQATVKKDSKTWEGLCARMYMAESRKVQLFLWINCTPLAQKLQTQIANSQCSKTWWMDSSSLLQIRQSLAVLMPLTHSFSLKGSRLTQALQAKILIFARRFRCHSLFQRGLRGSLVELPTSSFPSTTVGNMISTLHSELTPTVSHPN